MKISEQHKDFFERVYEIVRLIPQGKVTSYGAIAKSLGVAKSARMVGWAMNASGNQKEYVPAHRVVNRNGVLTGKVHFNPPEKMQQLLEEEGVKVFDDKVQNLKECFWNPFEELSI